MRATRTNGAGGVPPPLLPATLPKLCRRLVVGFTPVAVNTQVQMMTVRAAGHLLFFGPFARPGQLRVVSCITWFGAAFQTGVNIGSQVMVEAIPEHAGSDSRKFAHQPFQRLEGLQRSVCAMNDLSLTE